MWRYHGDGGVLGSNCNQTLFRKNMRNYIEREVPRLDCGSEL